MPSKYLNRDDTGGASGSTDVLGRIRGPRDLHGLSRDELTKLADVMAVWVFDGKNQLVYRNLKAESPSPQINKTRYPVIDHTGQTIAHLVTESP